jgi:hypothetical protein
VKEFLSHAGVPYELKNVETDLGAYRDLVARGFRAVPVTIVGEDPGVAIRGFDRDALTKALAGTTGTD